MTNTQLWAFTPTGSKIKLDLYETDPIKLTFTAENLVDLPTVNSTYSQTFRMPATGANNQFFDFWFNVNANDFDVSQKVSAEIITEAGFFIDGQIRLQKVYRNYKSTLVDYEILFLGEVRDFSSQVGEGFMNSIDCSDLSHTFTYTNIEQSWDALAGTTNGLKQGNVLYPLVEYGYTYNSAGQVTMNTLQSSGSRNFLNSTNALDVNQWRPWIRAKYLIDRIFASTDYSYTSVFFESDLFQNLYVNATGNTETADTNTLITSNLMQVVAGNQTYGTIDGVSQIWSWPQETFDQGNCWNGNTYTAPLQGPYVFNYNFDGDVTWVNIGGGGGSQPWPTVTIEVFYKKNGVETSLGFADNGSIDPVTYFYFFGTLPIILNAGDTLQFGYRVTRTGNTTTYLFETTLYGNALAVTQAPETMTPGLLLSNKIKTIDWFKSIIKRFRMVMVPDRENPRNFIIEPWEDYIQSGTSLDWTHKVDGSKDIQFEPLFYTQAASIKFTDQMDTDHPNDGHIKVFKEVYGTRIFDSLNDLLKDQRTIDTVIAPTPVERIEGTVSTNIIIPHFAKLEVAEGQTGGQLRPIAAKPRLLFWNGMKAAGTTWYAYNDFTNPQAMTTYPMVSYMSEFPATSTCLNLSWELEYPRFNEPPIATLGTDVYTKFWKGFIESTYSKEARKMTATFILDAQDLKVQFNDSIFIKDSWWRILKITDAPLTGYNAVKVELIKLFYAPGEECDCEQYYVTDARTFPEGAAPFNYINCNGEPVSSSVFQTSVVVCACEPFTTGDPQVFVTASGQACNPLPPIPVPVDVNIFRSVGAPGGSVILQRSETGTGDWIEVISRDIPIGVQELTIPTYVDSGQFVRVGYSQTTAENAAIMEWSNDGTAVNSIRFTPAPVMTFLTLEEKLQENHTYNVNIIEG